MKKRAPTVVICLSPYHGGMEMDAIHAAYMLQEHADVSIILKQGSPSERLYHDELEARGVRVFGIAFQNAFSPSIIYNVRKIITRNNIRNVVFFGSSELRSLYFALWGKPTNLIVRHGTTKSRPKKDPLHRLIYSRVAWHVAICRHIATNVEKIIPFGKETRLKVIYSSLRRGSPRSVLRKWEPGDPVEILHMGRVTEPKGQIDAILACSILEKNQIPFRLSLVGTVDPGFRNQLERAIKSCTYRDKIECIGHTTEPEVWYQKSHVFLFPSHGEGLSNAFLEALSHGLICIAYRNTSFPELVELGFKCVLAKDRDTSDLARCLLDSIDKLLDLTSREHNQNLARRLFNPHRESLEYRDLLI